MKKKYSSYEEAVRSLYSLQKFGIKFGLSKTSNLLEALGNPQNGQRYIHIAGTNGKGSVASFIASILREAGLRVGLYISPHLVRFTERFTINNKEIAPQKAHDLIQEVAEAFVPEEPPTFFEATTAMAISYFAREKTDIAIMEVGMGGRLDATNVIQPLVSVITNISMEHQFYLGSRLLDIAREKAGIIKTGVDVVSAVSQPAVIDLIASVAREKQAPFFRVGKDTRYRVTQSGFHFSGKRRRLNRLPLGLKGPFQARNAALALTALERLEERGVHISSRHIHKGLETISWPGRMHVMAENPMILIDGAHNPAAARALASAVRSGFQYGRLILVIGVMKDKDIGRLLREIVPVSSYVIYSRPVYPRAADPEVLAAEAESQGKPGEVVQSLSAALDRAREIADPGDLILVTGSLFTVGEALACLDPQTYKMDEF